MSNPKLNLKEESSAKKTRSPPKKAKVEQSVPRKKKLKTDAEKTAEKAHQLSYVTHSGEGEGLLFFGNVILPFVDHFPKDLELYRILTTRLSEVAEAQKHE